MAFDTENFNKIFESYKQNIIKVLQEEYNAGRLTGSDYTTALVQIMGEALTKASDAEQAQEKLEADTKLAYAKLVKDNELTDANTKLTLKKIDEIDNKLKLALMKTEKELEVMSHNITKIDTEILVMKEKLNIEKDKLILENKKVDTEIKLGESKLALQDQEFDYKKLLNPKVLALKDKELQLTDKKIEVETRTAQSIADKKFLEMFKIQMDAWSLMFTTGELESKPSIISDDRATELYNYLADYR